MKVTTLYILAFMLLLPSLSFAAGGWTGESTINRISLNKGNIVIFRNTYWPNPDLCGNGRDTTIQLVVKPDNPYFSEIYALLVASFLQGTMVNIYTLRCVDVFGTQYPKIDVINITH